MTAEPIDWHIWQTPVTCGHLPRRTHTNIGHLSPSDRLSVNVTQFKGTAVCLRRSRQIAFPRQVYTWQAEKWLLYWLKWNEVKWAWLVCLLKWNEVKWAWLVCGLKWNEAKWAWLVCWLKWNEVSTGEVPGAKIPLSDRKHHDVLRTYYWRKDNGTSNTTTFYCVWLIPICYMFRPYMRVIFRPLHKWVLKVVCMLGSCHAT